MSASDFSRIGPYAEMGDRVFMTDVSSEIADGSVGLN